MKSITRSELLDLIRTRKGSCPITILANTDARSLAKHRDTKEANPYRGCRKIARVNGFINFTYENSVNNQRKREGLTPDFKAEERKWGSHEESDHVGCIVEHNGKFYLSIKGERVLERYFEYDGKRVELDSGFLPKPKPLNQGVDKEVVYRNYAIDSIKSIKIDGEEYIIV